MLLTNFLIADCERSDLLLLDVVFENRSLCGLLLILTVGVKLLRSDRVSQLTERLRRVLRRGRIQRRNGFRSLGLIPLVGSLNVHEIG